MRAESFLPKKNRLIDLSDILSGVESKMQEPLSMYTCKENECKQADPALMTLEYLTRSVR